MYINKYREMDTFFLEDVAKCHTSVVSEIISRVSYANDVVEHMLKGNGGPSAKDSPASQA